MRNLSPIRSYGTWLHNLVCLRATRQQFSGTFFLRNRPALELMRRLAHQKANGSTLRIAVLGCSIGAEVYSILWSIRSARPDLKVLLEAMDISKEIVSFAEKGIYAPDTSQVVGSSIFERLTEDEMVEMFDWDGDEAKVKLWLREGITWNWVMPLIRNLLTFLGLRTWWSRAISSATWPQPMPKGASATWHNWLVPGGYLFVSGVDLDVRTKIARELSWEPVRELMVEIHNGDPSVRADWPWEWWGLEPLNRRRHDWQIRYAAAFRIVRLQRQ